MAVTSFTDDDVASAASGRHMPHPLALAWFGVFASLLLTVAYVAMFGRATDGGPIAQLMLPAPKAVHLAAKMPAKAASQAAGKAAQRPSEAAAPPPPEKIVKPLYAGSALVADPALVENTDEGPLPRIADDGRTPMAAYAPAVPAAALAGKKRIALVITGLGISPQATMAALDVLPAGVTLAFAPFGADPQRWVNEARLRGHEVLLQVPMEPYDFPDSDPGPHTLRPMLSESGNSQRLQWVMSCVTGYAGLTNLMGGRFLASEDATAPVLTYLARRGVLFYDGEGTAGHSTAGSVAGQTHAPYVASVLKIDTIQSAPQIDQRLSDLETDARKDGAVAGTGFLYPVTLARVAEWAKGLQGRGFALVPASAIVADGK